MPIHDWTRVDDGIVHDFHYGWIVELRRVLNCGGLPAAYFAMIEEGLGGTRNVVPSDWAGRADASPNYVIGQDEAGGPLLTDPPRTRVVVQAEREVYARRERRVVIRCREDHRVVALIEIVSAAKKASPYYWFSFMTKALAALNRGIHLLILDLHPPTRRDPQGVHGSIWQELTGEEYQAPAGLDRTLAAYSAGPVKTAYVEPVAVGAAMPDMPLFLTSDGEGHILVPLESTYMAGYAPVAGFYREILDAPQ